MSNIKELMQKASELSKSGNELESINLLKEAKDKAKDDKNFLIEILNDLAGAYRNCGFYDDALNEVNLAIKLLKELGLSSSIHFTATLINKANILRQSGEHSKSKQIFDRTKAILDKNNIRDYIYVSLCNNYSLLLESMGEYDNAYSLQMEAINILTAMPEHSLQLATSYNNLYSILILLKDYDKAENALLKAESIYKKTLGNSHPLYAAALNNLAELNVYKKDTKKALALYNQALAIIEKSYGINSEAYKTISNNIKTLGYEPEKKTNISNESFTSEGVSHIPGLKIAEFFYYSRFEPLMRKHLPELLTRISVGLFGEGSECLGFDDKISRDHDFEARLIACLPNDLYSTYHKKLVEVSSVLSGKVIVTSTDAYFSKYIGCPKGPKTFSQWRKIPEDCLRTAVNGKVFINNNLEFADIRKNILKHYPEDLRLKKIAFCLNKMAQSGQYNYGRSLKRNDVVSANFALTEFIEYYIRLMHLFNKVFTPFYKWSYRSMCELKNLPPNSAENLKSLSLNILDSSEKVSLIESMCQEIVKILKENKLSGLDTSFLTYQAGEVAKNISDTSLRNEDTWIE